MEEKKDNKKPYSEHFMEMLENDTRITPKPASDNDIMNIIHYWLEKPTKPALDFLNPKGKPPRTKINYLGHMFAKAGIPKDVAYKYVKERYFKTGMDEEAFAKEFEDEYDKTGMDLEWIQRKFKKK